jgi:Biliverdin reductase, catalytic/Oxidoreductase family, NAD-binding Rossmann fold
MVDGGDLVVPFKQVNKNYAIKAVIVCTENDLHDRTCQTLLCAGKHVCVESPMALSLSSAVELFQFAAFNNRILHVEHIELLTEFHIALRDLVISKKDSLAKSVKISFTGSSLPLNWGHPAFAGISRIARLWDLYGPLEVIDANLEIFSSSSKSVSFQMKVLFRSPYCSSPIEWTEKRAEGLARNTRVEISFADGTLYDSINLQKMNPGETVASSGHLSTKGLFAQDLDLFLDQIQILEKTSMVSNDHGRVHDILHKGGFETGNAYYSSQQCDKYLSASEIARTSGDVSMFSKPLTRKAATLRELSWMECSQRIVDKLEAVNAPDPWLDARILAIQVTQQQIHAAASSARLQSLKLHAAAIASASSSSSNTPVAVASSSTSSSNQAPSAFSAPTAASLPSIDLSLSNLVSSFSSSIPSTPVASSSSSSISNIVAATSSTSSNLVSRSPVVTALPKKRAASGAGAINLGISALSTGTTPAGSGMEIGIKKIISRDAGLIGVKFVGEARLNHTGFS